MPNWCNNFVEISGSKEQLDRVEKAFTEGRLCDEFIPIPAELRDTTAPSREDEATRAALIEKYGSADWYDFCVNNWGLSGMLEAMLTMVASVVTPLSI